MPTVSNASQATIVLPAGGRGVPVPAGGSVEVAADAWKAASAVKAVKAMIDEGRLSVQAGKPDAKPAKAGGGGDD